MSTNHKKMNENNTQTRKQYKQHKKQSKTNVTSTSAHSRRQQRLERKAARESKNTTMRRIFPILLRFIVISCLFIVALLVGLVIGYSILGDGAPTDVFQKETWKHIIDLVKKE